ncbi:ubiquinol-cytochrome c reductase cytochrome b subunit [Streptoalloteichus tenebrarius]|uniref:Cytochrome bc1 complex cytochrome b subunit n=1 Tax=Streptoalloteichus tenebrarius (strain ATCC 17920 / DSM 40477 / JCM 4838 / CBS 697.72 / NBRC 16177 / NCIMB 11028 / NRRL B-12390 / A12253. 1 / ISP 5477) TaxID=1933 RepID=A0ABT1HX58_STRSD|nr:cytochrome bc complex cytochrome b subunit [Streptoalloteichus tenebrarius]MCP2260095.1 ubiquinol-cytochrome c reductase cytochrome b subunit [Streptoalloteichus tenebrarius]BFF00585.1 cytochrome bc complex cytochrome b subunit [Streptoalloteichus tenebrarius]
MSAITTPAKASGGRVVNAAREADERFRMAAGLRRQFNKVFPTHWSFMLGEIALYSFVVLLLSGIYLTLFFDPSMAEVQYQGPFDNLRGVHMSRAFESSLHISFEVRGGLFARQLHHWAALLFMASLVAHMFRVFFTGAFRKPREINWLIGVLLFIVGMFEGFTGYSLPDDLLSGTGLRIMSGIVLSVPVLGTWVHWALFGGEFPGTEIIPRLYTVHILLLPGIILALVAAHLAIVWYQKHTQFPGVGRKETNVVGVRIMPVFAAKAGAFFFVTLGVLVLMAGLFQINPIWNIGPYNAAQVSAATQPDWYVAWSDGFLRLWPAWEVYLGNWMIPATFFPAVGGMTFVFVMALAYPAIERKLTKDTAHHNLLQRPRDVPVRTGLGMMAIAFIGVGMVSAFNDIIADKFNISLNAMTWAGRIGLLLLPPIAYYFTYRVCIGLQRSDREVLEHGIETGIIKRLPHGEFIEVHQPLGGVDEHGHAIPLEYQGASVPKKMNKLGSAGHPVRGSFLRPDPPEETVALDRARHEQEAGKERLGAEGVEPPVGHKELTSESQH